MDGLNAADRLAYNFFGAKALQSGRLPSLEESLRKAQMPVRAEAYLAKCWMYAIAVAVFGLLLGVFAGYVLSSMLGYGPVAWLAVPVVPALFGYITFLALVSSPGSTAKARRKNIDLRMPYATNYMAAMASAGVLPADIFRSLAKQDIYGEAAKECAMIYKDLEVHGKDIVTALRRAIDRSPSIKFQELLQGAITTVTSGGDLTGYFRQKAARYQWENRVEQKQFIETMGLMAETYVTAAVAGPLFLIVMVAIIVLMGSGTMEMLQMIIFLLLPVINGGFAWGLLKMIPEV